MGNGSTNSQQHEQVVGGEIFDPDRTYCYDRRAALRKRLPHPAKTKNPPSYLQMKGQYVLGIPKTELDTPVLWVDLDRLEENIAALASHFRSAGVQWRPHTKGIKIPAIAHKLLAAGAIGVTCAKLSEAEVMVAAGITDILIANQVTGKQKLPRLASLCRQADVKVAVDNPRNIAALGAAAVKFHSEIGVVIELDGGLNRAGTAPGDAVVALARLITQTPGVCLRGLMMWEGHTIEYEPEHKRQAIEESIGVLTANADLCRRAGIPIDIVSCGGSGTYKITPFLPGVTEIQAGGAIFCDNYYQRYGVDLSPAIFVQCTVTSRPNPKRIVFDAGFKSLPDRNGTPTWVERDGQGHTTPVNGVVAFVPSAEHGAIELEQDNTVLDVGDLMEFIVGYTDETICLYDQLVGVRKGIVEATWAIQGRGKLQ